MRKKIFDGYIEGYQREKIGYDVLKRVWKTNNTLIISLPLEIVKKYGIEVGDVVGYNLQFFVKTKNAKDLKLKR